MDERIEEVLEKYDFKVRQVTRVRGALCLDTDKGIRILKSEDSSRRRVEFENNVTKLLLEKGYKNVDYIVPNAEGMLITTNSQGDGYLVKQWFLADECRVKEKEDLILAAGNLAKLHGVLTTSGGSFEEKEVQQDSLLHTLERHNREMKHVKTYIRAKKQKNEFERSILKAFDVFYERAEKALSELHHSNLLQMEQKAKENGCLNHGSYTYHNILLMRDSVATVNFDKADFGLQLMDLYYFLRKVMEKNNWRVPLGDKLIREYIKTLDLDKESLHLLGVLLYYPEKFWKILNHYYNSKKSWIAQKDMEKLDVICEQEWQKILFLQQLFGLSF